MMLSCMSMLGVFLIAISSIGIQYDNNCATWKKGAPSDKRRKTNKIFLIIMLIFGILAICSCFAATYTRFRETAV